MTMQTCAACEGFVPPNERVCPNCAKPAPRRLGRTVGVVAAALGGGAFAMTLMACYGRPPGRDNDQPVGSAGPSAGASASASASSK